MDVAQTWKACLAAWPDDVPRRGVLVTVLNEQIPFSGFLTSEEMLLLDRQTPDTVGSRQILLPYCNIAQVKIIDVVKPKLFKALGFQLPSPPASGR